MREVVRHGVERKPAALAIALRLHREGFTAHASRRPAAVQLAEPGGTENTTWMVETNAPDDVVAAARAMVDAVAREYETMAEEEGAHE